MSNTTSVSVHELLDELKRVFPDTLPELKYYSPEGVLKAIGNQEVIRFIERKIRE